MAITSAFQADDAGSIPAARSNILKHLTCERFNISHWIASLALYH